MAGPTVENRVHRVARQSIIERRAGDVLDADQRIVAIGAAGSSASKVNDDRARSIGVAGRINAHPAVDQIVAQPALQRIVAANRAIRNIGVGQQPDRSRTRTSDAINAVAVEAVVAAAANQQVIAIAASQNIGIAIAGQLVVAGPAREILEPAQRPAARAGGLRSALQRKRDGHSDLRATILAIQQGVAAAAAGEDVVAEPDLDQIIAAAAVDHIVVGSRLDCAYPRC